MLSEAETSWGIVGGGMLGLTLAHELAKQGRRVTLFESADALGGLASAWELETITGERIVWDRHYHVTLLSDHALRKVLSEIGLADEMQWVETRTGVYADGRLHSVSNTAEFLRFPALRLPDKLRLGATIFYAARIRDWQKLEQIPVADWLRKLSGNRTFEKFWLPLLRSKLGENYQITSAAFIWTTIARLYAARRTGLKKEMFGYLPGGYARILARFAEHLQSRGVSLRTGHIAEHIVAEDDGRMRVSFRNGRVERFDHVVITTPASVADNLCAGLSADERRLLRGIQYQGIICASVVLKQSLADFYVTNLTDTDLPFTGVIEMSALVDKKQFGGQALVYLPKYLAADDPAWQWSDAEIQASFVSALERMYAHFRRTDVLAFRVSRVRQVFPLPTLNYSAAVPRMVTSVPGLYLVNSTQIQNGTLNVNETVQLAVRAVKEITCAARQAAGSAIRQTQHAAETDSQLVTGS